jgi:hypothetical protein
VKPQLLLSLPLLIGCGPEANPRLETEHITFHGELEGACEAFGALYEREVRRIEHELGRELLEPVEVYVGLDEVEQRCPEDTPTSDLPVAGCVVSSTEIVASFDGISLQLADVARRQHGVRGIPFIEKALPRMIGLSRPFPGHVVEADPWRYEHAIAPQLAYDWSEEAHVNVSLAMHFLHWAKQAYGPEAVQAWLWSDAVREGSDGVDAAFAEATGQTVAVAQARWSDEAEREVYFDGRCHGLPAPPLPAHGLVAESAACCDAPGVEQSHPPSLDMAQQCFTVSADTEVEVELLAGDGTLVLRPDGCLASGFVSPLVLESGQAATVTLSPCLWRAMVVGPERCDAGHEVRYAITPR